MNAPSSLENKIRQDLRRALGHFKYSYDKVRQIDFAAEWDEETLETLESFPSRFARLSDLFIARFVRLKVQQSDPSSTWTKSIPCWRSRPGSANKKST